MFQNAALCGNGLKVVIVWKFYTHPNSKSLQTTILNLMRMVDRAIFLFPAMFSKDLSYRHVNQGLVWERVSFKIVVCKLSVWKSPKFVVLERVNLSVLHLELNSSLNFRLVQIERICRQQNKRIYEGRLLNENGKCETCLMRAFSPFSAHLSTKCSW